jgi:type IV secretory pathway VirB9-like protein
MMHSLLPLWSARLLLCGVLVVALVVAAQAANTAKAVKGPSAPATNAPRTADIGTARVIQYGERDVAAVRTKLRYTTLIVLPKNEQILDFTCGDKEYWVINGNQNFAYIKPAKTGAHTNLNLVTASGNVYSFTLAEISEESRAEPDLKIFIEAKDPSMIASADGAPKFVSVDELEKYRRQAQKAKEETQQVRAAAEAQIENGISQFVSNARFPYRFDAGKKPFFVRAMCHDAKFTYIQARPEETPALYEIRDGEPNLVNFTYKNGVYVIDKILDRGYLAIGKKKLGFSRQE